MARRSQFVYAHRQLFASHKDNSALAEPVAPYVRPDTALAEPDGTLLRPDTALAEPVAPDTGKTSMDLGLRGKIAVVTGGRGAWAAPSPPLWRPKEPMWPSISILRRSAEAADQLVDQLQQTHGVSVLGLEADVGCEADVARMFDTVQQRLGLPTVLVNNAAICPTCQVVDTGLSQWDETLRVNLTGTFLTCREFVARLTGKDVADSSAECRSSTSPRPRPSAVRRPATPRTTPARAGWFR